MIETINTVIKSVGVAVEFFIGFLPGSPFRAIINYMNASVSSFPTWIGMLNWVIPFAEMVVILEAWGLSVGIWYGLSVLLRWLKAVA